MSTSDKPNDPFRYAVSCYERQSVIPGLGLQEMADVLDVTFSLQSSTAKAIVARLQLLLRDPAYNSEAHFITETIKRYQERFPDIGK